MIHVHQTKYSKIESGEISLKPEIAVRISMILKVPVKDFAEISRTLYYITTNSFTESEIEEDVKEYDRENILEETIINIIGNLDTIYNELICNRKDKNKI